MIYKMTLNDSADEMTFDLLEVPIVDKDIEGAVDNVTLDGNQYTDYLWLKKQFIQKWSILCDDEYTRLRGFYTRQFENADVPSYRLYYGDDIVRNSTESGENIQFSIEGVADGIMSLTQIDGNTTQNGTPTPSAPVPVQTVTGRQTVMVTGKNLLRNAYQAAQTINGVTITSNADGTITANGTATGTINFFINGSNTQYNISAGTYTLSTGTTDSDTTYFMIVDKSFSGEWSSRYMSSRTITVPSGGGTIAPRIVIRSNTTLNNVVFKPMIERGSTATTFEPYQGQSYGIDLGSIELCKIGTYQDRIYKDGEKWWLHKEIGRFDITGTESWSRSGRTTSTVFAGVLNGTALTNHIQIGADGGLSNRFTYQRNTTVDGAIDTYNWSGGIATTLLFCLSTERASDVTSFKTWLTNNPTTYYYVLATPTTTEITNEAVLEGLEALVDEAISVGQHNIYTDTPNAIPTLTFDLTEYLSKSTTIIPETAVRLTLTDGGVINACGCRKDVQLTMRETIE